MWYVTWCYMLLQHWLISEYVLEKNIGYSPGSSIRFLLLIYQSQELTNYRIPLAYTKVFVWLNASLLGHINCFFYDTHLWRSGGVATPRYCYSQFHFKSFTLSVYASARFANIFIVQVFHCHWLGRECIFLQMISPAIDWELTIIIAIGSLTVTQSWV